MATQTVFLNTQCSMHCCVWAYAALADSMPSRAPGTPELNIKEWKKAAESDFSGPSHQCMPTNTPISNGNPGSWMHNLLETSRWRWYYGVGNVFMEHVRTHNPYKTIPDVCEMHEHCCISGALIHDNSISGR